jgi:hypothetical protein
MLPLYLAGAAVLGVGAYLFTHQKKIPPAVAQAAVASPPPAPVAKPSASTVVTPNGPEAQAAAAALQDIGPSPEQSAFEAAKAQATAAAQQAFQNQFPGTGINPGIQSATQFNPNPGALPPDAAAVASAAQSASDALLSGGAFASPAAQVQSAVDLLNQFTNPSE